MGAYKMTSLSGHQKKDAPAGSPLSLRARCLMSWGQPHRSGAAGPERYASESRSRPSRNYSLSPAVIWVAESSPSEAAAASGHTQLVKAG